MPPGLKEKLKRIADDDGSVSYPLFTALSIPVLEVNSRSHGIQHYPVKNYEQEINRNVILKSVGGIDGRVVDSGGRPLGGFEFTIITMTGPDDHNGAAHCVSGDDGSFSVPAIAVGEAAIVAADSRSPWSHFKNPVEVQPGEVAKAEIVVALHNVHSEGGHPNGSHPHDSLPGNVQPHAGEMRNSERGPDQPGDSRRFMVRGTVTQSDTGAAVEGLKMKITSGSSGLSSQTFVSAEDGTFSIDAGPGYCMIEFIEYPADLVYVGDQESIGIEIDRFEVWHSNTNLMKTRVESRDPLVLKLVDLYDFDELRNEGRREDSGSDDNG